MTNKFIVITSINYPSQAIQKFSLIEDWKVIVVADLKTPVDWHQDNVTMLTIDKQQSLPFETVKLLPWNHYARKNIGYLYAMMQGAEMIYETDDDNIPYDVWHSFHPMELDAQVSKNSYRFINTYSYFCHENVWPRGFPLNAKKLSDVVETTNEAVVAPIQQGLADLEPDVDAIYRLVLGQPITFDKREPLFVGSGRYCPFNSQNTLWYPEAFQYLFLPAFVPSRVTDIWRGYIAQRFLHRIDQGVLFCNASVFQDRNPHNLLDDFREELKLYTEVDRLTEALDNFSGAFEEVVAYLVAHNFLDEREVDLFDAWIKDFHHLELL